MVIKRSILNVLHSITSRLNLASRNVKLWSFQSTKRIWIPIIYLIVLFLIGGGLFNAMNNIGQIGINSSPIVPNSSTQNMIETIIILITYSIGSLGVYGLYLSGKQVIRARAAEMFFLLGIVFVALSLALGYYVLWVKCPPTGNCG